MKKFFGFSNEERNDCDKNVQYKNENNNGHGKNYGNSSENPIVDDSTKCVEIVKTKIEKLAEADYRAEQFKVKYSSFKTRKNQILNENLLKKPVNPEIENNEIRMIPQNRQLKIMANKIEDNRKLILTMQNDIQSLCSKVSFHSNDSERV